jgi:hypothetical protein
MTAEPRKAEDLPPHYEGGIPVLPGPADRQNAEREREKEGERQYKRDQTRLQAGMLATQILLVFFGLAGTAVSVYQSATARESAQEAKRAADLASDSFEATYGEHGVAERNMQQMIDQTTAQLRSAQAAQNSIAGANEQMRLDQRAWLGAGDPKFTFSEGKPYQVSVSLKDVGKTPALNVHSDFDLTMLPKDHPLQISDLDYRFTKRQQILSGTIFPTAALAINRTGTEDVPKGGLDSLKNGDEIFYAYGTIFYNDVFDASHWVHFCYFMNKDLTTGGMCTIYNDTDDRKGSKP